MSDIKIKDYRGLTIYFRPDYEQFYTEIDGTKYGEKRSYGLVVKFIDEYYKENAKFKPFVVKTPGDEYHSVSELTIVGIRKDGRFIYQDSKGDKKQLSESDETRYLIHKEENEKFYAELASIEADRQRFNSECHRKTKEVRLKITGIKLTDVKSKYIQP